MPVHPERSPRSREISVFISSTFRDMHAEREELVKQVFPRLRKLCEERGVVWSDVDLRWGVTDEQKAEGHALPICLAEIERCRPYFIGLLGERYGPAVDKIHPDILEREPWLRDHLDHSLTEMEILHGVLRNSAMAEHAFFYFRDPAYLDHLPEIAKPADFRSENVDQAEKLSQLKARIRESGFPVRENYADPKALGQLVLKDFTALIDRLYPIGSQPSPLDREAMDQDFYAASRERAYIRRQADFDRLDRHAASEGEPLVVLGESGVGKSALLANWALDWRKRNPETPLLLHFIGSTPDSANWVAMVRRILGEFQRHFGVVLEIPEKPDALREAFANALHMVAAHGRVVLVLDALNQIEDRDGAPDLVWLPPVIPSKVRLVISTLPGRSWNDLQKRAWPVLTVEPLSPPEREALITNYLKRYAKELSAERIRRIVAVPQSNNALYLTTLLNELHLFGSHEELDKRIDWYLEAANPFELYGKVIARWESDYEGRDPESEDIVGESLSRLWAARRGLSETELRESMGASGSPLPQAVWSPLYLAARDALVNRGGLLTFAHDFLREAVREAYLPTVGHQRGVHRILAEYFHGQPQGPRQLDELPWQWQEAAAWQSLTDLLAQPSFLGALWKKDTLEVKAYWTGIETHSSLRMEQVYAEAIRLPTRDSEYAWAIGILLEDTGKLEDSLRVFSRLVEHDRERGDRANLQASLGNQASILYARGDLDGAMALYKEEERLCRELGNKHGLQRSLGNQAVILNHRGDLEGAMALHKEKERLCRELGNKDHLQTSLGNQAVILQAHGDLDGAMALYKEQERLCRELGNEDDLQTSLGNQAVILMHRGDLDGAMALHKEEERVCRELGNKDHLQTSLGNQAVILMYWGELDGAMALHKEEEQLCRELGNKDGLIKSLGNQGNILGSCGDLDGAMALHKEAERLSRELGDKDRLQASLGNQAVNLQIRGDLYGAMALYKEQENMCRELGNPKSLSIALINQALVLSGTPGRKGEARRLADEALVLATRHGYQQLVPQIQLIRKSMSSSER